MATMTVWNKGKRLWLKSQVRGLTKDIGVNESAELDEAVARRLVMDYPQDFSLAGRASPSSAELDRREQSIRDREANLDKREAELDEREGKSVEKMEIPESIEKLVDKLSVECLVEMTTDHPAGFDTTKAAGIITAYFNNAEAPDVQPATKSDLIAEAKALGINADSRWSVAKLGEAIAEKKASKA